MKHDAPHVAARFLEQATLWTLLVHVAALPALVVVLLPGLPAGAQASLVDRATYVAGHPWLWRLAWIPLAAAALSVIVLSVALWRTPWIPRPPAALLLPLTLAAAVPDLFGQTMWAVEAVGLAERAKASGNYAEYMAFEQETWKQMEVWGGALFVLMACTWSWCLWQAGVWSRTLTVVSAAAWGIDALRVGLTMLPDAVRPPPPATTVVHTVAYLLLLLWLALAAEHVFGSCRPDAIHGREAPWRHPRGGWWGGVLNVLGRSHLAHALGTWLPLPKIASEISDCVYLNYLVEAQRLEPWVPCGLELQRLGPDGRYAMFSLLVFRHGNVGPAWLGPLRRFCPSPLQTNWRIYVRDSHSGAEGVYFVTMASDNTWYALAARLCTSGVPIHVLRSAEMEQRHKTWRIRLDPGGGTAPDLLAELEPAGDVLPTAAWRECFESYHAMLAWCVPQQRALSSQPWYSRIVRQEVRLDIPLADCRPLAGTVVSQAVRHIVGDAVEVSFCVPRAAFTLMREEFDYRPQLANPALGPVGRLEQGAVAP
jgi:hypothetical protein